MNFLKKVGIAAALFGAVTVANAQITGTTKVAATTKIIYEVTLPQVAKLTAGSKNLIGGTGGTTNWFKEGIDESKLGDATNPLAQIGTVLVESNIPSWNLKVASKNDLLFKTSTGTITTLKCSDGTNTPPDADIKIFACLDKVAASGASCKAPLDGTLQEISDITGDIKGAGTTGAVISKSLKGGAGPTNFDLTYLADPTTALNRLGTFLFYAGVDCNFEDLFSTATADYSEQLTFTLVAGW